MTLKTAKFKKQIRILFFTGALRIGGKERRLIELLSHLKYKHQGEVYELLLVINYDYIHYPAFEKLGIPCKVLGKRPNHKDPKLFFQFYRICKEFRPDIIHAWGAMQAFYAIPASLITRIPIVNSQIANAPPMIVRFSFSNLINRINFIFSKVILANSEAGLKAYRPPQKKSRVIYNGINLKRFSDLPPKERVRQKYGIKTPFTVVMVASFSPNKDHDLFYQLASRVTRLRDDITFIGAGGYKKDSAEFARLNKLAAGNQQILFPGNINDVEALVNACDIGVLFSPNGEGISNAILEYMALGKPVIANDAGGTWELVRHDENGYLIHDESVDEIANMLVELIDDPEKHKAFGAKSRDIIEENFSLETMGKAFEKVYYESKLYKYLPKRHVDEDNDAYDIS